MDDMERLRQRGADLQARMLGLQEAAPERIEAADRTGTVRVSLGHDGLPVSIQVGDGWQDRIRPHQLGAAVAEAAQQAMSRRAEAWSTTLEHAGPGQGDPAPSPGAENLPRPSNPRSLTDIAEDVLGTLDTMLSAQLPPPAQPVQGATADRMLTVTLTRSGQVSCTADARWAAQQSGSRLTRALGSALVAARNQLREEQSSNISAADRAARLSAEIQAASSEAIAEAERRSRS